MTRSFSQLLFICLVNLSVITRAQEPAVYPKLNGLYLKSYLTDGKDFIISPASWQARQWIELGVVAGAGVLAFTQDERTQHYAVNHRSEVATKLSDHIFNPFGDGKHSVAILAVSYVGGLAFRDARLSGIALTAAKSLVVATVGTHVVKQLCHRHRPYQDAVPDAAHWDGPFSQMKYASFFSGHSSTAWSIASVFALEYRKSIWVPVLAYSLAAGTAFSRVYDNQHWLSDVVIGSAFGFVTGRFMWKQSHRTKPVLAIYPSFGQNENSVTVSIPINYR